MAGHQKKQENEETKKQNKLVIATRLHLGRASSPPSNERLTEIVTNMEKLRRRAASSSSSNTHKDYESSDENRQQQQVVVVIAVDATPKVDGYDYVQAVRETINKKYGNNDQDRNGDNNNNMIHVLPVTPWGKFVPALNAIVIYAKTQLDANLLLFVSAEIDATSKTINTLCRCVIDDPHVVVAGAALPGHDYQGRQQQGEEGRKHPVKVQLTGRTTPWNTLCVWDLHLLSMVGFACVSDIGGQNAGVEECAAIAIIQKLFPQSKACLVKVNDIGWEEHFEHDEERRKWHEQKMKSKVERPAWQLDQLNHLTGTVYHI